MRSDAGGDDPRGPAEPPRDAGAERAGGPERAERAERDGAPAPSRPRPHRRARATTSDGEAREAVVSFSLDEPGAAPSEPAAPPPPLPPPAVLPVVDVETLDWDAVRRAADPAAVRARGPAILDRLDALLAREGGPGLLFDDQRAGPADRAVRVAELDPDAPLWFVGDLHGDLLALEAALALARGATPHDAAGDAASDAPGQSPERPSGRPPRLVFLGDLFDDGGYGLEVLLRVFELVAEAPGAVCLVVGNHDEALGHDGTRFTARVSPSDFADRLNAEPDPLASRAAALAVRLFAAAPRALFFPDGLLAAHGGFPLVDLHAELEARGDWNDPRCLTDFVWTRAHPKARKKLPNRASRGSQFGHEDFAAFCALAARLGRPVTHMVRGHDHVDDRWAVYPAYAAHPVLTTNALSRRLPRESFGPFERVPTVARWVRGALPQVHRLHVPGALVRELFSGDEGGA